MADQTAELHRRIAADLGLCSLQRISLAWRCWVRFGRQFSGISSCQKQVLSLLDDSVRGSQCLISGEGLMSFLVRHDA